MNVAIALVINLIYLAGDRTPGTVQFVGLELGEPCMNIRC